MKILPIFGLLLVVFLIVGCSASPTGRSVAVPVEQKYCDKQIPHTTTEHVCNSVPYECQKSCKVEKVVIENVPLIYTTVNHWKGDQGGFWTTKTYNAHLTIRNDDNTAGIFKVKFNLKRTDGSVLIEEKQLSINPYTTKTITSSWHSGISDFTFEVIPPTKEKAVNKMVDSTCPSICYRQECRNQERVEYTTERVPC